jgi:hypothetical protein
MQEISRLFAVAPAEDSMAFAKISGTSLPVRLSRNAMMSRHRRRSHLGQLDLGHDSHRVAQFGY